MRWIAGVGKFALGQVRRVTYVAAVVAAVFAVGMRPRTWSRTVRSVLARQVVACGVDALQFTSRVGFLVGVSVVVQVQLWLGKVGQSQLLGPVLVAVVIRELGPLLANVIVIGRSGNAIAAELGNMKLSGEVRVLDAQGLDPFTYLVLPRVVGMAAAVFCLTVTFIVASLVSGYVCGLVLLRSGTGGPQAFIQSVAGAIAPVDVFNVVAKSVVPGLLSGVICCTEGLAVAGEARDVPQAATRSVQRSVVALFLTSAVVSLLTYL